MAPPRKTTGPRWETTTQSALDEVAEALLENPVDPGQRKKDLTTRKLANTQTSISFGRESVDYTSDTVRNSQNVGPGSTSVAGRAEQADRIKAMKKALTTTSFTLGDQVPSYESVNHEEMRKTAAHAATHKKIPVNADLKAAIKKSSIHFGNEVPEYKSTMTDCMQYHGNSTNFGALKDEVTELKKQLRKHNFTLGDESVLYETDYARGYGKSDPAWYVKGKEKEEIKAQVAEIRKCHFSLGQEKIEYKSDTRRNFETVYELKGNEQSANAKKMKAALQKTTIVIGDDEEYM